VSGSGALNKYGVGVAQLYRANTFSGGVNLFAGTVEAYDNSAALGTGAVAVGEAASATNVTLRVGNSVTLANAITVNTGSGTRTIANDAARAGNATLSGGLTLNKDATFDITFVTQNTHDRINVTGAVTGTGGIVKNGTGTLLLLATGNTYSGTTDIQAGKLYLGGAGRLGTGDVTIASGANLDFGTGTSQVNIVANNISGEGAILQSAASTDTRFTGDVTNTGGLTINNGTLRIGNAGTPGAYSGNTVVNSGAARAFDRSNAYTHSGTISGAGAVSKVNTGVVTLSGDNSYSGLTQIFGGAIVADHASALGTSNIRFNALGGGTPILRYTASSAATDWATRFNDSDAAIRLDTNGNDVTLAGAIDSTNTGGLIKLGAGTLTLGGINTYTGNTASNAGTLLINGSTASGSTVTVGLVGTLGGSGTIGGAVTVAGTLAPGNSPGTLNFGDDLTLQSTATLSLEITGIGVGEFDVLNGDGANTLNLDGILALDNTGYSATIGDTITVFTNWSSITGTFSSITGTDLGGGLSWDTSDLYDGGSLTVVPEPATYALLGGMLALGAVMLRRRSP
jgi:autotransporter-associated beta strand protein